MLSSLIPSCFFLLSSVFQSGKIVEVAKGMILPAEVLKRKRTKKEDYLVDSEDTDYNRLKYKRKGKKGGRRERCHAHIER